MDIGERLLFRDGVPVALTPKAFEILCVLVQQAGHLVSKEELIEEVWPDSHIEESSLARNVYLLRKALGEGPDEQPYIQTVPRRGYRFVVGVKDVGAGAEDSVGSAGSAPPVEAPAPSAAPSGAPGITTRRPWRRRLFANKFAVGLFALLAISAAFYFFAADGGRREPDAAVWSLAILPFKSIDAQAGDEQLGLGIADAILTRLSKIPGVSVLPTTAVFKYSGRERDPVAVGRELGVEAVLDGTIQRSDGRIRVTAQLVRVNDGRTLWADKFDEPRSEFLILQDVISEQIARTVGPQTGTGLGKPAKRYSENAAAYESYLMGFYFWCKRAKEDVAKAIPYLQRAVELDPDFALARAILADCYLINASYRYHIYPADESLERARAEATKALASDDTIAEAHIVMAQIRSKVDGDSAAAESAYKRGLELNPNHATGRIRYSYELFYSLRLDEALREARRGQELDPLSPAANTTLSFMLIMSRDYDGAIKFARKALELNPRFTVARVNLSEAYLYKGMHREALVECGLLSEVDPVLARWCSAQALARASAGGEARALLARLKRPPDAGCLSAQSFAAIHVALGEKDAALSILESAPLDMKAMAQLRLEPQWDALRPDQRFDLLLTRANQPRPPLP